jgi:hypothetical protein
MTTEDDLDAALEHIRIDHAALCRVWRLAAHFRGLGVQARVAAYNPENRNQRIRLMYDAATFDSVSRWIRRAVTLEAEATNGNSHD